MTITPEEIARLRALEAKATPGPWKALNQSYRMRVYEVFAGGKNVCTASTCCEDGMDEKDCNLIASSRNALPRLLDEVERLRADLREALALLRLWSEEMGFMSDERYRRRDALLARNKEDA